MNNVKTDKNKNNTESTLKNNIIRHSKLLIILSCIILVITVGIVAVSVYAGTIRKSLINNKLITGRNPEYKPIEESVDYNDEKYTYNNNLINIVVLGADNDLAVSEEQKNIGDMGQTDAVYLISIDTKACSLKVYAIPRDTMCEIEVHNKNGKLAALLNAQIALQYNYALNCVDSSKLSADAVSKLMYNIPVNRVCVFNCEAIGIINDSVGGVEVTIENDFTDESGEVLEPEFYKGNTLKLNGEQAVTFVRERDCSIFQSAMDRVSRQEQYINNLVATVKKELRKKPLLALDILDRLRNEDCIYTDISSQELMYIARYAIKAGISMDDVITIPGEVRMGEEYEEYHVDSDELKQLVVKNFYNEIK